MMWEGDDEAESDLRMCIPTGPLGSPMSYTRVMGGEGCGLSGEGNRKWDEDRTCMYERRLNVSRCPSIGMIEKE